jgi:hypothetical protein
MLNYHSALHLHAPWLLLLTVWLCMDIFVLFFFLSVFRSVGQTRYTKEHEWVRLSSATDATVGITDYAQSQLGDVVFVDLPEVNCTITLIRKTYDICRR